MLSSLATEIASFDLRVGGRTQAVGRVKQIQLDQIEGTGQIRTPIPRDAPVTTYEGMLEK